MPTPPRWWRSLRARPSDYCRIPSIPVARRPCFRALDRVPRTPLDATRITHNPVAGCDKLLGDHAKIALQGVKDFIRDQNARRRFRSRAALTSAISCGSRHGMDVFTSAAEFLRHHRPERPVLALRPHAARRAAAWFLATFPGRGLYAANANAPRETIGALVEAGVRPFDVASLGEIERMAAVEDAELYFMNPIKSREAIVSAYRDFGVRSFDFDSDQELDKIVAETGGARDLNLYLRVACPNTHS